MQLMQGLFPGRQSAKQSSVAKTKDRVQLNKSTNINRERMSLQYGNCWHTMYMTVYEDHQPELNDQNRSRQTSTPTGTKGES